MAKALSATGGATLSGQNSDDPAAIRRISAFLSVTGSLHVRGENDIWVTEV
jgi:hypothetical protein